MMNVMRQCTVLLWLLTVYPLTLSIESMLFIVQKCVEWFIPSCFVIAFRRGAHTIYLLRTGTFCAAFWFAIGCKARTDEHAPSQSILFMMHTTIASWLHFSLSKGVFTALDGFMTSIEQLWHGKKGCKQRKKKFRRKARKAVQFGKPGEPALHTQANDSASVSIGAATRGELVGPSLANTSGAPAKPVTGTKHPGHTAPPVKQSSAHTAQAPTLAEEKAKEASQGIDQDLSSQQHEKADHSSAEDLSFSSSDNLAPASSERSPHPPASNKKLGALAQNAYRAPSDEASTPSPRTEPAVSVDPTPSQSVHPLSPDVSMSDAITHAEPTPKLKENKEVKTDIVSSGDRDNDSWRLAARRATSSWSSTDISSKDKGSTAAGGDCGGAEQQEAADAAEVFPLQPTDPPAVAVNETIPKEEQKAINRPLQPHAIVQDNAAGSACAEQQEAAEAVDSLPAQPIQQQGTKVVGKSPLKPTKEEQKAASSDPPLQPHKTEQVIAAGNHLEQPTDQEGEVAASKHPKQLSTGAVQDGAGTLPQQLTKKVAAACDEPILHSAQKLPAPARTPSSPSPYQEQQRRPYPSVLNRFPHSEGVSPPPSDLALPPRSFSHATNTLADPSALGSAKTYEASRPSSAPGAPLRSPLHRPTQGRGRGMIRHHYNHSPFHEPNQDLWQQTHLQSPAPSPLQSPTSVLTWGSFGAGFGSDFGSDFGSECGPAGPPQRVIKSFVQSERAGIPLSHTAHLHSFSVARSTCADPIALESRKTREGSRPSCAFGAPLHSPLQRPTQGRGRGMTGHHFKQAPAHEQSMTSWQQLSPHTPAPLPPHSPTSGLTWGSFGTSLSTDRASEYGTDYCPTMGPGMGQVTNSPFTTDPGPACCARNLPSAPSFGQGKLSLEIGSCMIPHPEKAYKGGEDALFVSGCKRAFGVADGVGGWAKEGVCSGEFARRFMTSAEWESKFLQCCPGAPSHLLRRGHCGVQGMKGSCTACILVLEGDQLHAANLGDSGFVVLRDNKVVYKSKPQQQFHNCPFQLYMPGAGEGHLPHDADSYSVEVQVGDTVVVGTDGFLDNVFDLETAAGVFVFQGDGNTPQTVAERLADLARINANLTEGDSPFAASARAAGKAWSGGKVDDITVIVAQMQEAATGQHTLMSPITADSARTCRTRRALPHQSLGPSQACQAPNSRSHPLPS